MENILNVHEIITIILTYYKVTFIFHPLLVSKKWMKACLPFYVEFKNNLKYNSPHFSKTFYSESQLKKIKNEESEIGEFSFYLRFENKIIGKISHVNDNTLYNNPYYWYASFYINKEFHNANPKFLYQVSTKNMIIKSLWNIRMGCGVQHYQNIISYDKDLFEHLFSKTLANFSFTACFDYEQIGDFDHFIWDHQDDSFKTNFYGVFHYTTLQNVLEEIFIFKKIYDEMYNDFLKNRSLADHSS